MTFFNIAGERRAAVIGNTVAQAIGTLAVGAAGISFDCVREPGGGSDLFQSGSDLGYTDLAEMVFTHAGVYELEATSTNEQVVKLTVLCWPSETLEIDELLFKDRPLRAQPVAFREGERPPLTNSPRERNINDRMSILRSLAQHCSLEAAAATLENAPAAPYFGALPEQLGLQGNLASYGAAYA